MRASLRKPDRTRTPEQLLLTLLYVSETQSSLAVIWVMNTPLRILAKRYNTHALRSIASKLPGQNLWKLLPPRARRPTPANER